MFLLCHLSTSFFPYCFTLRYVTLGVLIWLFLSVKGLSGIDRISPLAFLFLFFCFLFFSFIPVRFLLSPVPRRWGLLLCISYKNPLPPGSILSHRRGAVSIFLFLRLLLLTEKAGRDILKAMKNVERTPSVIAARCRLPLRGRLWRCGEVLGAPFGRAVTAGD